MKTIKMVDAAKLIDRQGVRYEANSNTPFTGVAVVYWPNGKRKITAEFRNGKEDGKYSLWSEQGEKKAEGEFRDGKEVSLKEKG